MSDYQQIARVIHYLNEHYTEQPSLSDLASEAGLSPTHFQRKFTSWTGVSPKLFLQSKTFSRAKDLLVEGKSAMDASYSTGLTGPGRLHDLCVKLVAATPGEIKERGTGLEIEYDFGLSPFGACFIAHTERGVVQLSFLQNKQDDSALIELKNNWSNANVERSKTKSQALLDSIFSTEKKNVDLPLQAYVKASQFQLKVWQALLEIPYGTVTSYGSVAKSIRIPGAARAVGTAVSVNTIAYLIPCHRVIRETGIVGQYRWGAARKKFMLAHELHSTSLNP
jgi:AraC family transcriptional regulator of adaptative response/methylated-DNA-[protein]-cysteine methyltransferase